LQRVARSLWAIREAFGDQYVLDRMDYYCKDRIEDRHREFAEQLAKFKYSGLAGLDGFFNFNDQDVPV
jgi:hypothetical protein